MLKNVIKFGAQWCNPCQRFKPIFEDVSKMEEYKDIIFSEVDIDENMSLTEKYNIKSVPTILLLDEENNVLKKLIGCMPKSDFIAKIQEVM